MRISQKFFFLPFPFPFANFCIPILSDSRKKFGVDYLLSLEMEPWSILGITRYFTNNFAPKTANVFFLQLATSECGSFPKRTVARIDLSHLYYLLIKNIYLRLNWRRHKWYKMHDLSIVRKLMIASLRAKRKRWSSLKPEILPELL